MSILLLGAAGLGLDKLRKSRQSGGDGMTDIQRAAYYRSINYQRLLAQIKARGLTVEEALAKWDAQKKAKAEQKRSLFSGVVQAKQDKAEAQLVAANAAAVPFNWKPLLLFGGFIAILVFLYKKMTKK